jgi:hypothetical protein
VQQRFLVKFVFGQLFYKDTPENKSGQDSALICDVQVGLNLEISVNVSPSIL